MKRALISRTSTAVAGLLSAMVVIALVGCGATAAKTSASHSSDPSAPSRPSSTTSPDTSQFLCGAPSAFAPTGPGDSLIDGVRTGAHSGYDRLTIQFQGSQPERIELSPQVGAAFETAPKGGTVQLAGQQGLVVNIFSTDAHTAYTGPTDMKTGLSGLLEVYELQDFEGYVTWGLGLSKPACYRAVILTNPTRLVIDIEVG